MNIQKVAIKLFKSKKMLILSTALNFCLLTILLIGFFKIGGVEIVRSQISELLGHEVVSSEERIFKQRQSLFESLDVEEGSIVFLGDSLIQYNEWSEMFPDQTVFNRGISGDTTHGVLSRIDSIVDKGPGKIVLSVGINDLVSGVDTEETLANYSSILDKINEGDENIDVIVMGILPININMFAGSLSNGDIEALNKKIEMIVSEKGFNFINSFEHFESNGNLSPEFSEDGIHLTGEGYSVWKETIETYIN